MDPLSGLLDGPRASSAFLLRTVLDPPWSLRIHDESPISLISMLKGEAWITHDDGDPVRIAPGEISVVAGTEPYTVSDAPSTSPQIVIHPGQRCTTPDGQPVDLARFFGVRTWGTRPDGAAVMLSGTYESASEISRRLLDALPPILVLPHRSPLLDLLADEMIRDEPGQSTVLDRALDLLLITVLRDWFARPEAAAPSWYVAQSDPVVGPALRRLQDEPGRPWTVESLAREIGVSRAALARRFSDLVGVPPMTFLAEWRLAMAADLLREPGATVVSVARKVGYTSAFAFSAAFKRVRGLSPAEHRAAG